MRVLIVGAGPTGLVMAHELARFGVQCRLIDKTTVRRNTSRAAGILPRTIETFTLMGVAEDFLSAGRRIQAINAFEGGERIARIAFNRLDTSYPFVLGLSQEKTERILEAHINRRNVGIERGGEIMALDQDREGVSARVRFGEEGREEIIRCDYLIGCDGAHSTVRHLLGLPFRGGRYRQVVLLADVSVRGPGDVDEVQLFLHTRGVTLLFPLPDGLHRLIATDPLPNWGVEPTLAQCQFLIDSRGLTHLRLAEARWTSTFRIAHRKVDRLKSGRVFLAGDAAHIHSPMGAQGMNAGIQDAFNLAWKLGVVGSELSSDRLLTTYDAERMPVDSRIIEWPDRGTRLLLASGETAHTISLELLSTITMFDSMRHRIALAASQLGTNYRGSSIVQEHHLGAGPRAGDRAPDATLLSSRGQPTSLFQLFGQGPHTLLLLWPEPTDMRPPESVLFRTYAISALPSSDADFSDADGSLVQRYGREPVAYLIRPDGYVAFRCEMKDVAKRLPAYLDVVFQNRNRIVTYREREAA